ncbi:MAG: type VI secretion system-associated FHA domain protein TagH [Betaproteobacteria bacterium]
MSVTVKIFSQVSGRPTLYATRTLDKLPITIGRDAACTIAVEDPRKHLSRFHVEITEQDGVFWMEVVSKVNPVTVKGRRHGPGTRLTIHSGDIFEMGEYHIHLVLPERKAAAAAEAEETMIPRSASATPEAEATFTPGMMPTMPPAPAAAPADEAIFEEATFIAGDDTPAPAKPAPAPRIPVAAPAEMTMVARRPAPAQAAAAQPLDGAFRAFLEGAGLPYKELSAGEAERLMRDCGAILRASVEGIMMLLLARAEMRKEFQAEERTMVAQRDNNPLKLMSDPHEAMGFLLDPGEHTDGFLDPVQSIGDACEDLRSHEIALMAAMRGAILGALRRVDPALIEREFESAARKGFSLASRKARLWEFFLERQARLSQEAQEDFSKVFGRDFMSAYQTQLRRMKGGK